MKRDSRTELWVSDQDEHINNRINSNSTCWDENWTNQSSYNSAYIFMTPHFALHRLSKRILIVGLDRFKSPHMVPDERSNLLSEMSGF